MLWRSHVKADAVAGGDQEDSVLFDGTKMAYFSHSVLVKQANDTAHAYQSYAPYKLAEYWWA